MQKCDEWEKRKIKNKKSCAQEWIWKPVLLDPSDRYFLSSLKSTIETEEKEFSLVAILSTDLASLVFATEDNSVFKLNRGAIRITIRQF